LNVEVVMVQVNAWMQMGVERRETSFEVESRHVETTAHCWYQSQFLWGWTGLGFCRIPPQAEERWRTRDDTVGTALLDAIRNTRVERLSECESKAVPSCSVGPDESVAPQMAGSRSRLQDEDPLRSPPHSIFMWVQLGIEWRETLLQLSKGELADWLQSPYGLENGAVAVLENTIWDWLYAQFGRGFTASDGTDVDDAHMEGDKFGGCGFDLVTIEQSIPRTRYIRLPELRREPG
jgi:hypothetical protein